MANHFGLQYPIYESCDNGKAIEWTPNTITSKVAIEENKERIEGHYITPSLKSYQMKEMATNRVDTGWKDVPDVVVIELKK